MASAAATTPPARGAMPWTVAGSSSPRARRAPSARSSARACGCHRSFHHRVQVYEVAWDCESDTSSSSSSSS
uniref:ZF-HD dimerization-type domain-containing protein n=1 Tax=Triticum urartu TaxID=4572 RepID=A0A8R7UIP1_TRIUA